ncbi:MAG: UDP-N-acetylglucosamine pyrophosphorylase [Myxococcales bacterium]|nr:UDP-N-acetylglucosamine pyrophosphorylase [Myxococcales bacterium]
MNVATVILAAGLGTRMKSDKAKVLHTVAGRPMIEYPVAMARALGSTRVVCVLGHQADKVREAVERRFGAGSIEVAIQSEQRGTGHAVLMAEPQLGDHDGLVLILYGDTPLLTRAVLERLVAGASSSTVTMMTARLPDPRGYGRVVRDSDGKFVKIVEEKDATDAEQRLDEINAGIYCGPAKFFFHTLASIGTNNAQGEIYLTDVMERAARQLGVVTVEAAADEVMGCNDRVDVAKADRIVRLRLAEELMRAGVAVRDPERLYVEPGVEVGRDTVLGPNVELRGKVKIGSGCVVEQGAVITDCTVGDRVHIKPYCVMSESTVANGAQIGPWCHIRPGSVIEDDVHLGNFVETKKTRMGRGAKANHLTYLGDADVGEKVNVGCGTITCNYDGYVKSRTVIEDGAFIGSDTQLVAPVTVGRGAVTAAGTTVYRDVPAGALALTRPELVFVEGWAERKREKMQARKGTNGVSGGAAGNVKHAPNFPKPKTKKKKQAPVKAKTKASVKGKPARRRG